ncbi:RhuM family protein [[Clostridium] innocuum]|uniref:RhuM family protein n=1 Tax=Clostridium innocuum TaxID=1522 RepID=UPI00325975DA
MVENFKNRDLSVIVFHDGEIQIDVSVSPEENTVWLSANQIAELFGRDEKTVRKHINNVFREKEVDKDNNTQKMRVVGVKQPVPFYTLDVIISVGYRVKSHRGVKFRKWANGILKDYMVQGYAVNEKRLQYLNKKYDCNPALLPESPVLMQTRFFRWLKNTLQPWNCLTVMITRA